MHKVQQMTQPPMQCLICGRGNIPDDPHTEDDLWFLDLERDVNWGDSTYLCMYCCERVGILSGLVGMEELKEVQTLNRRLTKKIHDLEARLQVRQQRLDRIAAGGRAVRRVKKEAAHDEVKKKLKKRRKVEENV